MSLAQRFLDRFSEEKIRENGIHVTDCVYFCDRRSSYPSLGVKATFDSKTKVKLRLGDILHTITVPDSSHEMTLRWKGIIGTVDEYDAKTGELLDKKLTFVYSEKRLPFPHHIRQLQYYAVLLQKSGFPIHKATVLYMPAVVERYAPLDSLSEVENELLRKKAVIEEAKASGCVPPPRISDECSYCPYLKRCQNDGGWPPEMLHKIGAFDKDQ